MYYIISTTNALSDTEIEKILAHTSAITMPCLADGIAKVNNYNNVFIYFFI